MRPCRTKGQSTEITTTAPITTGHLLAPQNNNHSPDFSPLAKQYASSRPGYPPELYAYLASLVDRREVAWDCATGNGQAAVSLVEHFDRVIATDISADQIAHAIPHERIEYRVNSGEESGLPDHSVDLVTVAAAVHWFDLERFHKEVRRVLRPGGVVAVWTYHIGHMEPPFGELFYRFYLDWLKPHFAGGAELVNMRYETINLPGTALNPSTFHMSATWTLAQMLGFIASWSGTLDYIRVHGKDPVDLIRDELTSLWNNPDTQIQLRWPLYLRLAKVD